MIQELENTFKSRDEVLALLRVNLQQAQERIKKIADLKRTNRNFERGQWVYLRSQPYKQQSVVQRHNMKLSPPPYFKMITEAITTLKDRTGSSQPAIARFIEEKYKKSSLPSNFKKVLSVQLKKFVKSERLVKCKNSYKISSTEKLQLGIKETQKKKGASKTAPEKKAAEKISSKGVQTRRLSQVKTPEVFKKEAKAAKMKRLSQVKTPDGFKKEKKSTPIQKKNLKAGSSSGSRAHNK